MGRADPALPPITAVAGGLPAARLREAVGDAAWRALVGR